MAVKKSDLYSSIWASCDELRGGMDASQYKDYVLFMLFIKYITDKYGSSADFAPPVTIPPGASFKDMIALKGKSDIGDKINTQIIQPLIDANSRLARSDFPDFDDSNKLGEGADKVDTLTRLIAIFEKPELDFSKNRAEHDDILGDAYEYLMRHFAQDSGKSKGQFYTPSEVSRIIAKVIGIGPRNTVAKTSAYDPTCGSGSYRATMASTPRHAASAVSAQTAASGWPPYEMVVSKSAPLASRIRCSSSALPMTSITPVTARAGARSRLTRPRAIAERRMAACSNPGRVRSAV